MRSGDQGLGLRLYEMLRAIGIAKRIANGLTFEEFQQDTIRRLAAERALEIISEASRHIPGDLKQSTAAIPWRNIAGLGNVIRHDYRNVSAKVIWDVILTDLDSLEVVLGQFSEQFPPPSDQV